MGQVNDTSSTMDNDLGIAGNCLIYPNGPSMPFRFPLECVHGKAHGKLQNNLFDTQKLLVVSKIIEWYMKKPSKL